jgi:pimeloyl-ACP methyl ester carboxylesterase
MVALDFPTRVSSLVLISTSPATPGNRNLPPPTEEFLQFVKTAQVDWSDSESVIDYLVAYSRMLAGTQRPFDEAPIRQLIRHDIERAHNFAATQNHNTLPENGRTHPPLFSIQIPTLVIHGTADPMFPLPHGRALSEEIPGAQLLTLKGAGHGIDRHDWQTIANAIIEHTDRAIRQLGPRFRSR